MKTRPASRTPREAGLECDDDNDCTSNDQCDSVGVSGGETKAAGSACDDDDGCTSNDRCDSAGMCSGEAVLCNTPPADFCSPDDTAVRRYESADVCNPSQGSCEYGFEDSACDHCRHACLHLPNAPRNLKASAGDAQVTLTWDGIDGALAYNVLVSQTAGGTALAEPVSVASAPYVDTDLSNGLAYYFAVSALVTAGEGDLSAEVSATPRISAPAQVSAVGGDRQVTITWESVDGADKYNLYWARDPGVTLGSSRASGVTSPHVHASLVNDTVAQRRLRHRWRIP